MAQRLSKRKRHYAYGADAETAAMLLLTRYNDDINAFVFDRIYYTCGRRKHWLNPLQAALSMEARKVHYVSVDAI